MSGGSKPEDIDELLDHVEEKFLKSPEARNLAQTSPKDCPCTVKQSTNWEEVDEMLKDFKFEDSNPFGKSQNKPWSRQKIQTQSSESESDQSLKKCFSVYLAGSFEDMGYCVPGAEKPCDKLKCIRCDFPIVYFDNFTWDPSIDYLFLRNNMPDFEKLAVKLQRKKGSRAYACQCQNLSISKLTNLLSQPQVRWICGKHVIDQST